MQTLLKEKLPSLNKKEYFFLLKIYVNEIVIIFLQNLISVQNVIFHSTK